MASEEPRPLEEAADTSGIRAASVPQSSMGPLDRTGGLDKNEKCSAADDNSKEPPTVSPVDSTMTSIVTPDNTATLPQETRTGSVTTSPANEQTQNTEAEHAVKSETNSSNETALSDIPQINSSSKAQPPVPKEVSLEYVRNVARSTDLATLEAGASIGLAVLDELQTPLTDAKQRDLIDVIEHLKKKGEPARTIVSVAGATGAGKSSLINAILNEEKLLPTNGMRACTAVITEISYNYKDDPKQPYRAEVEFIPIDDWAAELDILFEELVSGNQLCSTYRDSSTEAGIAYAKIRAVYPDLTHEMLVRSTRRQLEGRQAVRDLLGTTKSMSFKTAKELYATLQKYLDSTEKKSGSRSKIDRETIALWPLIKVVRIYCRADALSTGLCIVDLPGIHDSNAARSAVAKRYMAECTAVWLASPIKRAVDDKAAKELLGQSSKTQFKMDGTYSNVTFICTCSDAFEVSEIEDSLDHDGRIQDGQQRKAEISAAIAEKPEEISNLRSQIEEGEAQLNTLEELMQVWERISDQHMQGQQVYAPAPITSGTPRKRRRRTARARDIEALSDQEPLTGDEISNKVKELDEQCAAKELANDELEDRLRMAESALAKMQQDETNLETEILQLCVQRRNEFCKGAIRLDFAAGIREQDEEAQLQDDPAYDPSVNQRDYDKVARCLPVFTISSKAYQQLRATDKRLRTEIKGFTSLAETEIPAMQAHAKNMTKTGQIMAYKSFLNQLTQLLGTIQIFANNSDSEILQLSQVGEQERTYEVKVLEGEIVNLKQLVKQDVIKLRRGLLEVVTQGLNVKSSSAALYAGKKIEDVVVSWHVKQGEPVGRYKGVGLHFGTYKASCRRLGGKTPHPRSKDFNEDILGPFLMKLSTYWEQTFITAVPRILDKFENLCRLSLKLFHKRAVHRPALKATRSTSLHMLEQQLPDHLATIRDAIRVARTTIQSEQRNASRLFYPEVKDQMTEAYQDCVQVTGNGTYLRMREIMLLHVQKHTDNIYHNSFAAVTGKIDDSFGDIVDQLQQKIHKICETMCRNYTAVISCGHMIEASVVAREHLREVLAMVDCRFKDIANDQAEPDDSAQLMNEHDAADNMDMTDQQTVPMDATKAPNVANEQAMEVVTYDVPRPVPEGDDSNSGGDVANGQAMELDTKEALESVTEMDTSCETVANGHSMELDCNEAPRPVTEVSTSKSNDTAKDQPMSIDSTGASQPETSTGVAAVQIEPMAF